MDTKTPPVIHDRQYFASYTANNAAKANDNYAQWAAKFYQWGLSIPLQTSPFNDDTGKNCYRMCWGVDIENYRLVLMERGKCIE